MGQAFNVPADLLAHFLHGDALAFVADGEGGVIADKSIIDEKEFLEKLPEVAKLAVGDACTGSNPREITPPVMEKLLKCCFYDTEVDF